MGIGENIKRFRRAFNMEQKELAKKLHISDKTISSWECGRTEPKMGMIEDIANAFGITKTDLIEGNITQTFDTPMDFEITWYKNGGGKHPIELSEEEYSLILTYRSTDDTTKDMINRILKYRELLEKRSNL